MMRRPRDGEPTFPWCIGLARYWTDATADGFTLLVAVRCRFGDLMAEHLALLDTGAQWSIVGGELAEILEEEAGDPIEIVTMATRLGSVRGGLYRLPVALAADDGEDVEVPCTLLLAPSWSGPPVLGYRGLLERIRFALDPGDGPEDQWFSFGSAG